MGLLSRRALVLGLATVAAPLDADEVFLVGGGKLSGIVVSQDDKTVVLETGPGRVSVPAARVTRIARSAGPLARYRDRASHLSEGDAEGWLDLGFWARANDLETQAREAFQQVVRIMPNHRLAQEALGNVEVNGTWMSRDDGFRARGFVFFDGQWMSPVEHAAALQLREAEAREAMARREAALRIREAEARARQAEAEARMAEASDEYPEGSIPWPWVWGTGIGVVPHDPILDPPFVDRPPRGHGRGHGHGHGHGGAGKPPINPRPPTTPPAPRPPRPARGSTRSVSSRR
jgi:hypothetical protein